MAFSKELEEVIEATLADGVITEKERAVLHKKALLEGLDPDEVDVVIDGRLQQMQNEIDKAKQKIRKCPSCGEIIPAMTAVCPNCGQVIDTKNPDNLALHVYMEKLESSLVKLKENGSSQYDNKVKAELESMIRQGRSMYGDNKKIAYLISEVEASIEKFDRAHKKVIYTVIILVVTLFLGLGVMIYSIITNENSAKQAVEQKAQAQYTELCGKLDALETPDELNYKDVESQLLKITWTDISGDNSDLKDNYLEKKRAIAKQIGAVKVPNSEGEEGEYRWEAPDPIQYPDTYIKN